jgi:hypothetical protein
MFLRDRFLTKYNGSSQFSSICCYTPESESESESYPAPGSFDKYSFESLQSSKPVT